MKRVREREKVTVENHKNVQHRRADIIAFKNRSIANRDPTKVRSSKRHARAEGASVEIADYFEDTCIINCSKFAENRFWKKLKSLKNFVFRYFLLVPKPKICRIRLIRFEARKWAYNLLTVVSNALNFPSHLHKCSPHCFFCVVHDICRQVLTRAKKDSRKLRKKLCQIEDLAVPSRDRARALHRGEGAPRLTQTPVPSWCARHSYSVFREYWAS